MLHFNWYPKFQLIYYIFITNQDIELKLYKSIYLFVLHSRYEFKSEYVSHSLVSQLTPLAEFPYLFGTFIPYISHRLLCDQVFTNSPGSEFPLQNLYLYP